MNEKYKKLMETEAWKYGDSRGGTSSTKQGSYAFVDYKAGFNACYDEMQKDLFEVSYYLKDLDEEIVALRLRQAIDKLKSMGVE